MPPAASGSRAVTSVLAGRCDGNRGERAAGIAFQPLAGADPEISLAVELDRFHRDAAEQVQRQARGGGPGVEGEDAAAAAQPERSRARPPPGRGD